MIQLPAVVPVAAEVLSPPFKFGRRTWKWIAREHEPKPVLGAWNVRCHSINDDVRATYERFFYEAGPFIIKDPKTTVLVRIDNDQRVQRDFSAL